MVARSIFFFFFGAGAHLLRTVKLLAGVGDQVQGIQENFSLRYSGVVFREIDLHVHVHVRATVVHTILLGGGKRMG